MKKSLFLAAFISAVFSFIATANAAQSIGAKQYPIVDSLVGGISHNNALTCRRYVKAAKCNLNDMFNEFRSCVRTALSKHPVCKQSLAFFNLTGGGVIHTIKRYNHSIDVILADYVYIADQGTGYFLTTTSVQYVPLPINFSKSTLKKAPGYQAIAKKYKHVGVWQILDFPKGETLSHHRYRLIFTQQLKDGCNACAIVGTAKVAYDFTNHGKTFDSVKVLKLIPKKAEAGK